MSEFQPPDPPEPDIDAMWDAWFDQQEKGGYAVISRDEWKAKLDEAASIGYAEGRVDAIEEAKPLYDEILHALESILEISQEEHFIRGADSKLYEVGTIARLAIKATGHVA
jgi:hypothetical protein